MLSRGRWQPTDRTLTIRKQPKTEQELNHRPRVVAPEPAPPTVPDEEYYRQPAAQPASSTARLGRMLVLIGLIWLVIELIGYGPFFGDARSVTRIPAPLPNNHIALDL